MSIKQSICLSIIISAMLSMLFFIFFGSNGLVDMNRLKEKRNLITEKNTKLTRKNISLYRRIERLKHDTGYIENVARQELGLVRKNEMVCKLGKK